MAFQQFTKCIAPADFSPNRLAYILGYGALVGGTAFGIIALSGQWHCWVLLPQIVGFAMVVGYCENWLYARLICNGSDEGCIGVVVNIGAPVPDLILSSLPDKFFDLDWDTDYSINLLLQNCEFGISQADAEQRQPFGVLIKIKDEVKALDVETKGHTAVDRVVGPSSESAVLHAEFEGGGNYILMKGAEAALGLSIAALFLCLIPFVGSLLVGFLAALAWLAFIFGGLAGNKDFGSPSDVGVPEIEENHIDPETLKAVGADVLFVQGTWVFDPLHSGWNEIHPIKICTKVGCWQGDWSSCDCEDPGAPPPPDIILRLRKGFDDAQSPETIGNQALPEHGWRVHPEIDGCVGSVIL